MLQVLREKVQNLLSLYQLHDMKKQIFIVDDDPAILDALELALNSVYTIKTFVNGEDLLNYHDTHPDLVLLDKQLPGIDGLDVCRNLKEQLITSKVPVIILSASPHLNDFARLAGADEVLEKPFSLKSLRMTLERYLK